MTLSFIFSIDENRDWIFYNRVPHIFASWIWVTLAEFLKTRNMQAIVSCRNRQRRLFFLLEIDWCNFKYRNSKLCCFFFTFYSKVKNFYFVRLLQKHVYLHTLSFNQHTANCRSCKWAWLIPDFLTGQEPPKNECIKDFGKV